MSDADNQMGGSGDRFSKEDQDSRHGPKKETEKGDGQADEAAGDPR